MTPSHPLAATTRAVGGGLAVLAALTACSSDAATTDTASASAASASASSSSGLKDGTYSADGQYQSPGGLAEIGVTITLKRGLVTAVKVTPKAQDATAQRYESQFASGIAAVVVGKKLTDLQVGAVSGSSLTAQGFAAAVETIEKDAA